MIGKAWLLAGYHESEYASEATEGITQVDVTHDEGDMWSCVHYPLAPDTTQWLLLGVPKRYIEFIPPYLLEDSDQ